MTEGSLPRIPNAVRDAHRKGKLAVFVGSGLSLGKDVHGNFPSWNGIATRLLDLCREFDRGEPDEIEALRTIFRKGLRLEQMLSQLDSVKTLLDRDYQRALTRIFRPQDARAGAAHQQLVALKPSLIVTTNYDLLLEEADPKRTKYTWREADKVKGDLGDSHPVLFKVHGTAEHAETVILTKGEYEALARQQAYQSVFQWLFQTYTFLFVGYGVNDPLDLDQLMQSSTAAFGSSTERHFVLWHNPQGSAGRGATEDRFERDYNITPIFYTGNQQLPALLAAITTGDETPPAGRKSSGDAVLSARPVPPDLAAQTREEPSKKAVPTTKELRERLERGFSLPELELLIADAFPEIGSLDRIVAPVHPFAYQVNELVKYCDRRGWLARLAEAIAALREY